MKNYETIIEGIQRGVDRHWSYNKDLLRVKPEYLLTISVADEIAKRFDGYSHEGLQIKVEESTFNISRDLTLNAVGWNKYFKTERHKVSRRGKVDIYVQDIDKAVFSVIELKGFDPSLVEIRKDVVRLIEYVSTHFEVNKCLGCFLAYPTLTDKEEWINTRLAFIPSISRVRVQIYSKHIITNEDPMDGIAAYYINCICLYPKDSS